MNQAKLSGLDVATDERRTVRSKHFLCGESLLVGGLLLAEIKGGLDNPPRPTEITTDQPHTD